MVRDGGSSETQILLSQCLQAPAALQLDTAGSTRRGWSPQVPQVGTASQAWPAHLGPEEGVTVTAVARLGTVDPQESPLSSCGLSSRPESLAAPVGPHLCCACKDGGQGGPCHVDFLHLNHRAFGVGACGRLGPRGPGELVVSGGNLQMLAQIRSQPLLFPRSCGGLGLLTGRGGLAWAGVADRGRGWLRWALLLQV